MALLNLLFLSSVLHSSSASESDDEEDRSSPSNPVGTVEVARLALPFPSASPLSSSSSSKMDVPTEEALSVYVVGLLLSRLSIPSCSLPEAEGEEGRVRSRSPPNIFQIRIDLSSEAEARICGSRGEVAM